MLRHQSSRRLSPIVLVTVLGALTLPGSALGATASESGGTLVFQAGGGEQNNVFIGADGGAFRVTDSGAPVTAGAACTQRSVHRVSCPTAGITLVQVLTADSDDSVVALIGSVDADLRGGSGADYLFSADGDDTLSTGRTSPGGFEQLFAGGGNDTLIGSPSTTGSTSMQAGAGDDELLGGASSDGLYGDLGADVLHGEGGSDSVSWSGFAGVTVTVGAGANDGEPGEGDDVAADIESYYLTYYADTITGSSRSESFYGFGGNDVVAAGGSDDYVDGGDNADALSGDGGNDFLQGGKRADDIVGGGGIDIAEYGDHASGVNVTINNVANDGASGGAEGDNVHTDVEDLRGTAFPDTLIGSAADNTIIGQANNDNIQGAGGDDELFGDVPYTSSTTGNDDLGGGDGDDNLIGGNGADDFAGGPDYDFADYGRLGSSPDVTVSIDNVADDGTGGGAEGDNVMDTVEGVSGGSGNDTLIGNPLANTLFGGFGADELHGGAGNDLLDGETPGACCGGFSGDVLDGGTDKDTVSYRSHTYNPVQVDIGGGADGAFAGTEGDDVMSTVENLVGSPDGSDMLTGNDQPNSISGRGGNDTLIGGAAADHLSGDFGSDTHEGQGGKDEINSFGDNVSDVDNCGTEADTAIADAFDTVNADCEDVIP